MSQKVVLGLLHIGKEGREMHDSRGVGISKPNAVTDLVTLPHANYSLSMSRALVSEWDQMRIKKARVLTLRPNFVGCRNLFANVWQQSHKASSLDRLRHGVLAGSRATGLATPNDSTVAIDQLLQQINVLVVDIHWTWPFAIDEKWILLFCSLFRLASLT